MEIDFKPKYYGSMVRVSVTTVKGGIEYTIHLEDIDAIPKEWIRKWNINNYPYTALLMSEIIPKMIEDWEKENEV